MPRGRPRKNSLKIKESKKKVSKEVQDIFFNMDIKEEEEVVELVDDLPETEVDLIEDIDIKEVEVADELPLSAEIIGEPEQFTVTTVFTDSGEEVEATIGIRKNNPPVKTWADGPKVKFKNGEKIMPKNLAKINYSSYECAIVITPGKNFDTYMIKLSRSMNETCVNGKEWKIASNKCKPYVSYWQSVSPTIKCK